MAVTHSNGTKVTGSLELFLYLNKIGGAHGVGRLVRTAGRCSDGRALLTDARRTWSRIVTWASRAAEVTQHVGVPFLCVFGVLPADYPWHTVYETPGGTILHKAHIDLEGITLDREVRKACLCVRVHANLCRCRRAYSTLSPRCAVFAITCRLALPICATTVTGSAPRWSMSWRPSR